MIDVESIVLFSCALTLAVWYLSILTFLSFLRYKHRTLDSSIPPSF